MKEKFNIKVDESNKSLPIAYWMPKMHKSPIAFRFIIASKSCVNKELSKYVAAVFKLFYEQIKVYHEKVKFFSGIKTFWILQNSQPVLDSISKVNSKSNAKCISTFDFSTLYTKLPHDKLLDILEKLINFCFKGGTRKKIGINAQGNANWFTGNKKFKYVFDKNKESLVTSDPLHNLCKQYKELCSYYSLTQLIKCPTRITCNTATLLDHICTNTPEKITQSGIFDIAISDHLMIYCTRKILKNKYDNHKYVKQRNFKNYNIDEFVKNLNSSRFPNYEIFLNVNEAYDNFMEKLMNVVNTSAPIKQ